MTPFRRDGHLSDLGLERLLAGELSHGELEPHLSTCAECAARLDGLRADRAPLPPLRRRPRPANRAPLVALVAVAAALLLVAAGLRATDRGPEESFQVRGGGPGLEVWAERGGRSERLRDGDPVVPGDHLGFRFRDRVGGQVLVAGVDGTGSVYPCWPPDGRSRALAGSAAPVELDAAIALDDTPGDERLIALRCEAAVSIDDLVRAGVTVDPVSGPAFEGCATVDLVLHKEER